MSLFDEFTRFMNPGEDFTKKTGLNLNSGVMPVISPISGGIGIVTKMFGSSKTAAAVPQAVPQFANYGKGALVIAGAGGAIVGGGIMSLFGGGASKKDVSQAAAQDQKQSTDVAPVTNIYHAPYENYSPNYDTRISDQRDLSNNTISNSAGATISKKQSSDLAGNNTPAWSIPTNYTIPTTVNPSQGAALEQAATQADGTNMALLAAIAGIALLGHGYLTRRKSK